MERLSSQEWIALASHRLSYRWRRVAPEQLDEVAADLHRDEKLRSLDPSDAADAWLALLNETPHLGVDSRGREAAMASTSATTPDWIDAFVARLLPPK